jgi:predicted phosphohydrolase
MYSDIDQSLFDIIIVSGDWGTCKIDHVSGSFKFFRKMFPSKIICGVLGNHDLWDKKVLGLENRFERIDAYSKEYNIHLLENNPLELDNYTIMGFNGWYSNYDYVNCNDCNFFPTRSLAEFSIWNDELLKREYKAVDNIFKYETNKKVILVTHFPIFEKFFDNPKWCGNPTYGKLLLDKFNFHIFGHTHEPIFEQINGKTIINTSAEYGTVTYGIFDFESNLFIKECKQNKIIS